MKNIPNSPLTLAPTGILGLDEILKGGLPFNSLYVVQGEPGSGKTTLAIQFLIEGVKRGEKSLYVTFSETKREIEAVAASHGWRLDDLAIIDLSMLESRLGTSSQTTLFHPSEIELNEVTELLLEQIRKIEPKRIVFDSISEMRLLAETPLRYRRQILALKQTLSHLDTTVLFLDDLSVASQDLQVQSIAHGVIHLGRLHHEFGGERRRIRILKLRGVNFTGGHHDFEIKKGGVVVHPRMVSAQHKADFQEGVLTSGSTELDSLLGGGLDRGTSSLLIGPAGTGKSTLGMKYAFSAVKQGEKVGYFCFDETIANFYKRGRSLGLDLEEFESKGLFRLQKVDPAEMSPGSFSNSILNLVRNEGFKVIMIDSLNGYIQAMPQEQFLILQLHELLAYLNNQGVVTLMMLAQAGMIGSMTSPVDLTYLADTVILTRFFESNGSLKKAVSVVKKRTGYHETTIREYVIGKNGPQVGAVLHEFQGVLTGTPRHSEKSGGK